MNPLTTVWRTKDTNYDSKKEKIIYKIINIRQRLNSQFSKLMCWKQKNKGKSNDLSNSDKVQIVVARWPGQRNTKTSLLIKAWTLSEPSSVVLWYLAPRCYSSRSSVGLRGPVSCLFTSHSCWIKLRSWKGRGQVNTLSNTNCFLNPQNFLNHSLFHIVAGYIILLKSIGKYFCQRVYLVCNNLGMKHVNVTFILKPRPKVSPAEHCQDNTRYLLAYVLCLMHLFPMYEKEKKM